MFRYASFAQHPKEAWNIRKLAQSGKVPNDAFSYHARMRIQKNLDMPVMESYPTLTEGKFLCFL